MPFSGERLRRIRSDKRKSREELAHQVGRSYSSVVGYECGTIVPPIDVAERLATSLGVGLAELITDGES